MKSKHFFAWVILFLCLTSGPAILAQVQIIPLFNSMQLIKKEDVFKINVLNQHSYKLGVVVQVEVYGKQSNILAAYRTANLLLNQGNNILNEASFRLEKLYEPAFAQKGFNDIYLVNYHVLTADESAVLLQYRNEITPFKQSLLSFSSGSPGCSIALSWSALSSANDAYYQLIISDCNDSGTGLSTTTGSLFSKQVKGNSYVLYPDAKAIKTGKTYCWEVLYTDNAGNIIQRSERKKFTIVCDDNNTDKEQPKGSSYYKMTTNLDDAYYLKEPDKDYVFGLFNNYNNTDSMLTYKITALTDKKKAKNNGVLLNSVIKVKAGPNTLNFPIGKARYVKDHYYLLTLVTARENYYIKFRYR